jgi:hypothetical protein
MGFFRGSVGTPKATAQFAKGLVELRNLFVDELNTGIFSILKPIQDAAIKNKNRLNGHTHIQGLFEASVVVKPQITPKPKKYHETNLVWPAKIPHVPRALGISR